MKKTSVVILGGGFAGLSAAMYLDKTLARRADVEVTLINRENFILFTPMLHEVAAGDLYPGDIVNPIRRILRHVKFVEAEVEAIDLAESGRVKELFVHIRYWLTAPAQINRNAKLPVWACQYWLQAALEPQSAHEVP